MAIDFVSQCAERFNAARALIESPAKLEKVELLQGQAISYVWGWQDAGGDVKDSGRASAFGYAYGTVCALYELNAIGSRPPIQDAWTSFQQFGEIRDWTGRVLDTVTPVAK